MTRDEILAKLDKIVSKEPSKWHEHFQYYEDNEKWLRRSGCVALAILTTLDNQGLSQKALADRMGISPQQVNKWVKGSENFTFETIAKIEEALNIELMSVVGDDFYKAREKRKVVNKDLASYNQDSSSVYFEAREIVGEPELPLKKSRKKI
jgi:transcriptional regulator with XRE-family HTH domain